MAYYLLEGDKTKGPFTINQLRSMWSAGNITATMFHCQEGDRQWQPLSSILHLLEPPPSLPLSPAPVLQQSVVFVRTTKSRGVYILLGLLFGCLGFHNFYAGHPGRGVAQLLITLLLGWVCVGLVITLIWSLVEVIAETRDGEGQRMT